MTGKLAKEERVHTKLSNVAEIQEATLTRIEYQIDAILHSIEDLETHYEYERVYVRDDLERTLNFLVDAKNRASERIDNLEKRSIDSTVNLLSDRLRRLETTLASRVDKELRRTHFKLQNSVTREARKGIMREGKMWKIPFWILVSGPIIFAVVARRKYVYYKKLHML